MHYIRGVEKVKVYRWGCDVYNSSVTLCIGRSAEFGEYLKKKCHCHDYEATPNHAGETLVLKDSRTGEDYSPIIWMPAMDFTTEQYGTLAHECFHAAIKILHVRGIHAFEDGKEEVTAYLFGAIYEAFLKQLHRDYKKNSGVTGK